MKMKHRYNYHSSALSRLIACTVFFVVTFFEATVCLAAQEMPARGNVSVLNILFLGLIAYFLVRAFRKRSGRDDTRPGRWSRRDDAPDHGGDDQPDSPAAKPVDRHEAARQAWDMLRSDDESQSVDISQPGEQTSGVADAGFDEAEFLEGAKLFFTRVQQVGTEQELDELKSFLSNEVYADKLAVIRRAADPVRTEVMLVTARLMEMRHEDDRTHVTVFYDAQLRKGVSGDQPVQVRSAWEFSRDDVGVDALWVLERINTVDH